MKTHFSLYRSGTKISPEKHWNPPKWLKQVETHRYLRRYESTQFLYRSRHQHEKFRPYRPVRYGTNILTFIIKECAEGCKMNDSLVKAKSSVLINVYAIMQDPELWTNLDEFIPERFLESSNEKISENQIGAFHLVAKREDSLGHHLLCWWCTQ